MRFVLVGEITYQDSPEGRVFQCLQQLLLHIPARKITVFATNLSTNWEYKGVRILPFFDNDDMEPYRHVLEEASIGLVYLNQYDTIKKIMKINKKCTWIVDSFSEDYVNKAKRLLPGSYAYKFNRPQAEAFSTMRIRGLDDCRICRQIMQSKGIQRGFITLNKDGVYYFDQERDGIILSETITRRNIKDAGDAFVAGVLYGLTFSRNTSFLAKKGIELSTHYINEVLKQFFTFGTNFDDPQ